MGKRKREYSSDDHNYDYIARKLKKLERKLKRGRRKRRHDSVSDSSQSKNSPYNLEDGVFTLESNPVLVDEDIQSPPHIMEIETEPVPSTSTAATYPPPPSSLPLPTPPPRPPTPPPPPPPPPPPGEIAAEVSTPTTELDSLLLEILGDDPSAVKKYGNDIQADLAVRLQHIATTGLSKETRKELLDKYLTPGNCTLIDAPELNPEIKAAVSEAVSKRDKGIELKQKQLARAISCLSSAITLLMAKEDKDSSILKLLMDANRLICDCQNADSVTRRNFVLFNLKKDMKDQMQKTKIDTFLFGATLSDTLKTAKSISKSGAELKSATPSTSKPSAFKNKIPQQLASTQRNHHLNWKAPPPSRRYKGTPRTREPAPRSQHASSSRTSFRPPPAASSRGRR